MKDIIAKLNDPNVRKTIASILLDAIHKALKETLK